MSRDHLQRRAAGWETSGVTSLISGGSSPVTAAEEPLDGLFGLGADPMACACGDMAACDGLRVGGRCPGDPFGPLAPDAEDLEFD